MTNAKKNEIAKELLPLLVSKLMPDYSTFYLLERLEEIIYGLEKRGYFEDAEVTYDPQIYNYINQDPKN